MALILALTSARVLAGYCAGLGTGVGKARRSLPAARGGLCLAMTVAAGQALHREGLLGAACDRRTESRWGTGHELEQWAVTHECGEPDRIGQRARPWSKATEVLHYWMPQYPGPSTVNRARFGRSIIAASRHRSRLSPCGQGQPSCGAHRFDAWAVTIRTTERGLADQPAPLPSEDCSPSGLRHKRTPAQSSIMPPHSQVRNFAHSPCGRSRSTYSKQATAYSKCPSGQPNTTTPTPPPNAVASPQVRHPTGEGPSHPRLASMADNTRLGWLQCRGDPALAAAANRLGRAANPLVGVSAALCGGFLAPSVHARGRIGAPAGHYTGRAGQAL